VRVIDEQETAEFLLYLDDLGPSRGHRQHWIQPIQSLNSRLFVDAKHCGMLRRIQIKANDVGCLCFELGIVAGHVAHQSMRLELSLRPHLLHGRLACGSSNGCCRPAATEGCAARCALAPPESLHADGCPYVWD
jgi:hypothetical protein